MIYSLLGLETSICPSVGVSAETGIDAGTVLIEHDAPHPQSVDTGLGELVNPPCRKVLFRVSSRPDVTFPLQTDASGNTVPGPKATEQFLFNSFIS